jgi:hypothetical protein
MNYEHERYMVNLFGLDGNNNFLGVDAYCNITPIELKSTTMIPMRFSTSRDVTFSTLKKWKPQYWILGHFHTHNRFFVITPTGMDEYYKSIMGKLNEKLFIADSIVNHCIGTNMNRNLLDITEKVVYNSVMIKTGSALTSKYIYKHGIEVNDDHSNKIREIIESGL